MYDFGVDLGTFDENMLGDKPQIYQQTSWLDTDKEVRTQKLQEQTFLSLKSVCCRVTIKVY